MWNLIFMEMINKKIRKFIFANISIAALEIWREIIKIINCENFIISKNLQQSYF